jgi:ferric enterobactin receptor
LKFLFFFVFSVLFLDALAQKDSAKLIANPGIIIGNVLDNENSKAIAAATVTLSKIADSLFTTTLITAKDGSFLFEQLPYGYYRLQISMVGYSNLRLDSIYLRAERYDFDLNDIKLNKKTTDLEAV